MKHIVLVALAVFALPAMGATCKISEYTGAPVQQGQLLPVAQEPAVVNQTVTYTTSTASSAFGANTRYIRIVCDAKAHFKFGTDPTATTDSPYVAADAPEYFGVPVGLSYKVAFVTGS